MVIGMGGVNWSLQIVIRVGGQSVGESLRLKLLPQFSSHLNDILRANLSYFL